MIAQTIRNVRICRSRRLGIVFLFLQIYHLIYSSPEGDVHMIYSYTLYIYMDYAAKHFDLRIN